MTTWMRTQTFFRRPIYVAMEDEGVSSSIIHTGGWESHIEKYIIWNMPVDGVFLDVGANLGFFSLLAANKMQEERSSGRVIAVEANPIVLPYLMASIVESGLEHRIDVIPYAASRNMVLVQMQENFGNNLGGVPMNSLSELVPSKNRKLVPTVALDTILVDLTRLDLVKMDIEGAEPKAIEGMVDLLYKFSPDIIMEINADCLKGVSGMSVAQLVDYMSLVGYKPHTFRYDVEPVTKEQVVEIVSAHNYYDFLFSKKMG